MTNSALRLSLALACCVLGLGCRSSDPVPPAPPDCTPACRAGYTCANGACVSACNPACDSGEDCVGAGSSAKCVPRERPCVPACTAGHVCTDGACVSACNPPCGKFEECDAGAPGGPTCVSEAAMLERRLQSELEAEKEAAAVRAISGITTAEPPPGAKRLDPNVPSDTSPPQPPPLPAGSEEPQRELEQAIRRAVVSDVPPAAPAPPPAAPTRSRQSIEAEIRAIDAQLRVGDYLEGSSQAEELEERRSALRSQLSH